MWFPLLIGVAAALLLPAAAGAKFTCEARGLPPEGIVVPGLPAKPVVGRAYTLKVSLPAVEAVNPAPYLGAEYCGEASGREPVGETGGWFRHAQGHTRGSFSLDLRFSHPGQWAVSFMDLDGTFYDLGLHSVRPAARQVRDVPTAGRSGGVPALVWVGAGAACLALGGGGLLVRRRTQSG